MQNTIPHFKYSLKSNFRMQKCHIDADGVVLHWIENLDEFFRALGYTTDMAKSGVLPDEFIWDEYIKDGAVNSTACLQKNIIEYLIKHSASFVKKYGNQYKNWIAVHADAMAKKAGQCCSCSMNPFCNDLKSDRNA